MPQTTSEESVTFSLKELAKIEEERVREEDARRARSREAVLREQRETDARKRAAEEARMAEAEEARARRAREDAADRALTEAREKAAIEVARIEAQAKARLEADNAMRAHELAVLRTRSEGGRKRLIYGLSIALGLVICGGVAGGVEAGTRMSALEREGAELREGQLSLAREREHAKAADLAALNLRYAALSSQPLAKEAAEARATVDAARSAVDPKAPDRDRLRAFGDALDALQGRIDTLDKLASLDRRREDLAGWAAALRKNEDDRAASAATRARVQGAGDSDVRAYETALDTWRKELLQATSRSGGQGGTVRPPTGAPCDPNVGDPMCDASGHRL